MPNDTKDESKEKIIYKFGGKEYEVTSEEIELLEKSKAVLPTFKAEHFQILDKLSENTKQFEEAIESLNSLENILTRMINSFSNQFEFLQETLKKTIKDRKEEISTSCKITTGDENDPKEIEIKDSTMNIKKDMHGREVSGETLKMYVVAKNKDAKKVYLPNSGFYVVLKCPSLGELNILYNQINDTIGEYGYLFGNFFYLFHDFKIKEIFFNMIKDHWLLNSNLSNWNKGDTLEKYLSFHDYGVLLHGISSLMFKNGYDFVFQCSNDKCLHNETITIDLNKIKFYILSKIPKDALLILGDSTPKKPKVLKEYQELLDLTDTFMPINGYRLHLKVPTMKDYLTYGDRFNSTLMDVLHDDSLNKINGFIRYNYFKIFTPWISRIDILDENGNVDFHTTDYEGIEFILETIQSNYDKDINEFADSITEFMKDTLLSLIAIPLNPCPKCNTLPENSIDGFLAIDPQDEFFLTSTMKLKLH